MWKENAPCEVTHPINTKDPNPRITSSSKTKKYQHKTNKPQPNR